MGKPNEWIIGASAGCDIVVTEPTVSGRHCRLSWQKGIYQLEDLGATNGTFVNGVQLTGLSTVTRDDRITLGQSVPLPWSQVQPSAVQAHAGQAGPSLAASHTVTAWVSYGRHLPTMLSAAALLIVVVLGMALLRHGGTGGDRSAGVEVVTAPDHTTAEVIDAVPGQTGDLPQLSEETETPATAQNPQSPLLKPDDPANSLYCLVVGDVGGTQRYRLGTACAIDKHRLLSSASIVHAAEQLADRFPKFVAVSADRTITLQAQSQKVHPEFAKAAAEVSQLKQRLAALQGIGSSVHGADPSATGVEDGNEVAAEITQLHKRGLELAKTLLIYDVAVLEVREVLPYVLTVQASTRPTAGESLVLLGLPVDNDSLFLDGKTPLTLGRETAIASVPATGSPDNARLYAKCPAEQTRLNWAGSPIVNSKHQVVAVYCRPSPADDPLAPPSRDLLEAAWADSGLEW